MGRELIVEQFVDAIDLCRHHYVDPILQAHPTAPETTNWSREQLRDEVSWRFDELIIKTFVETVEGDMVLSPGESDLAIALFQHLLGKPVRSSRIKAAYAELSQVAKAQSWRHVLEPMRWFEGSREHFEETKLAITKIANIVAKVDRHVCDLTKSQLKMIQWQLDQHLPRHDPPQPDRGDAEEDANGERLSDLIIRMIEDEDKAVDKPTEKADAAGGDENAAEQSRDASDELPSEEERETWLREGLAELDDLIGIESVRGEVKTLVNLCKFQQARQAHAMPTSQLSLHMVFTGNPGTGKTTVARLVGKLFGGLGVLKRGHLIETDRSGLVAEYQGQTATKTNETIDKALDGVLFIDEAYTLVPNDQADSYGQEAIATLLKRMEDERDRLVVILAGYTAPMDHLLKSNPGLSSRFSRHCDFPDYTTEELCRIFERLAINNHYRMTDAFRAALAEMIDEKVRRKDEHFGNGRMVRNEFENAIRNLANRVIAENDLSPDTLSTFTVADLGVAEAAAS